MKDKQSIIQHRVRLGGRFALLLMFSFMFLCNASTVYGSLAGRKIGLDPGHGEGVNQGVYIDEGTWVLDAALKAGTYLQNHGADIVMTRTTGATIPISQRIDILNSNNVNIAVSIHSNAASSSVQGIETFACSLNPSYSASKNLATYLLNRALSMVKNHSRGVKECLDAQDYHFGIIRYTAMPSSLPEYYFHTNPDENYNFHFLESGRDKIARSLYAGICDYYNVPPNFGGATCSALNYPTNKWQRVWYDYSAICLGDGPDEVNEKFDNNWGTGTIAYGKSDYIQFISSRKIYFPSAGTYGFTVGSDDGVQLWIDGNLRIDKWQLRPYQTDSVVVYLSTGYHNFQINYFENDGDARVSFTYSPPPANTLPTVDAFNISSSSITWGSYFTIFYSVSDHSGAGLNSVELWRGNDVGGIPDWGNYPQDNPKQTFPLSGQTSYSSSFTDEPLPVGTYWYGMHVVDNAGNRNDEQNSWTGGIPGVFGPVQVIVTPPNHDPDLSNGYVNPSSGDMNTNFYWYVNYYDQDGDSPAMKNVYIDGTSYTMSLYPGSGSASNGSYRYGPKNLSAGSYNYYFYFSDRYGGSDRLPSPGTYTGPSVTPAEQPVHFPDANLESAVEEALGISDPTPTDMLSLTFLNADSRGIVDLTGLQSATNLTTLLLWDNQISDIWPIAGLTNLTHLFLGNNQIMDISALSGLTNLTSLFLNGNQITDISPLSGLTNLTGLYLWDNQISNISAVSGLTNLTELFVSDNQVSDISAVSRLANLTNLSLYSNQISNISAVSGLTNLAFLYLWDNPLNTAAYCTYLPLILANNPGINPFTYDPNPNPLTDDCATNLTDLAVFVSHWLEPGCGVWNNWCGGSDLDHIPGVDLYDFAEFAQHWLAGTTP